MQNAETVSQVDPEFERLQLVAAELPEDQRVFIDPNFPDYMARRNDYFPKIEPAEEAGKWRLADDAHEWPGLSVDTVVEITRLADAEFDRLAACGLPTPERSAYTVVEEVGPFGSQRGTAYNYTRLIEGELLDPANPAHTPFALEYARAAIDYLTTKTPGDLFFGDLFARNTMIGVPKGAEFDTQPALFLIDTEPVVEPVTFGKEPGHIDNSGRPTGPLTEPSSYAYHLFDIQKTLELIPIPDRAVQLEIATLLHKTNVQLHKCGF